MKIFKRIAFFLIVLGVFALALIPFTEDMPLDSEQFTTDLDNNQN